MTWRSRKRKTRRTRRSMRCFCSKTHARRSLRCFCSKTHEEEEAGRRAGGGVCAVFVQRHTHRAFFFHRHLNKLLSFHLFTPTLRGVKQPTNPSCIISVGKFENLIALGQVSLCDGALSSPRGSGWWSIPLTLTPQKYFKNFSRGPAPLSASNGTKFKNSDGNILILYHFLMSRVQGKF